MRTVDVIVPCYRYGHFLKECVESVLAQSGPSVRVLVIDDASPDNTSEIAAELAQGDPRVTLVRHSSNRGHIATYNEGIDWASADYLLLLSADDYLLPGAFERAVSLMESHPEVGFTFGPALLLDAKTGRSAVDSRIRCRRPTMVMRGRRLIALSKAQSLVNTPTAVVRTQLQKRVGGYRPELPHAADVEMWLRLAAHTDVGYINTPQAVYRHHVSNMCLAYYGGHGLGDIEQRRAALCYFFAEYGYRVHRVEALERAAAYQLSCDAIDNASLAWEYREQESARKLLQFASSNSWRSYLSQSWIKFLFKRALGIALYRRLRSRWGRKRFSFS